MLTSQIEHIVQQGIDDRRAAADRHRLAAIARRAPQRTRRAHACDSAIDLATTNTTRVLAAAVMTLAIVLVTGATAVAARDDVDTGLSQGQAKASYAEPAGHPLTDGRYLGYVRDTDLPDATVRVDFVSLVDGRVGNARDEMLVYAGDLVDVGIVERARRPFWIIVKDDTIVELQTADDALDVDAHFESSALPEPPA